MGTEITKTSRREKIRRLLAQGYLHTEIAQHLSGGDARKRSAITSQIERMVQTDEETQRLLGLEAKGTGILGLPSAADALVRRAARGNIPAIKLLFEATGFHNPRIQHEHSGEVQITFKGLPRPERLVDVTDADVVEDADVVS